MKRFFHEHWKWAAVTAVAVLYATFARADGHFETRKVCVNGVCQFQQVWVEHASQAARLMPDLPAPATTPPGGKSAVKVEVKMAIPAAAPCPTCPTGGVGVGSTFHRERHVMAHGTGPVRMVGHELVMFAQSRPVLTMMRKLFCR